MVGRPPLKVFLVAGEHSGDALGGRLMSALKEATGGAVAFHGVGGEAMTAAGLVSEFPLADVAVMGPVAILKGLPRLVRRVHQTVAAAAAAKPDVVVVIDSPEFTQPIAKRIRRRLPDVAIVNYVSPSVWAWRPGRAPRMARYIDHVMALLPFEPEVHRRLGGPPCTYVGHPLIERREAYANADAGDLRRRLAIAPDVQLLVVLPGSRRSEVERLMAPFGEAVRRLRNAGRNFEVVIPAVDSVRPLIEAAASAWPVAPHLVSGDADKRAAFRLARAALAASGTVTLELALAGTPMVVAYRVDAVAARLQFLVRTPHFALSNLVVGERAFPELMQDDCTPAKLAAALAAILDDGPAREAQLRALARVPGLLELASGTPSGRAAAVVLETVRNRRQKIADGEEVP